MSLRTWFSVVTLLAVIAAAYAIGPGTSRGGVVLRSEHSQPAVKVPKDLVAVTPDGRTFHHPTCKFIHGPIEMIPAQEAVAGGYTPCIRCMREALGGLAPSNRSMLC